MILNHAYLVAPLSDSRDNTGFPSAPVPWCCGAHPPSLHPAGSFRHTGLLQECQRLTSALIAEWERTPADSQLSYPCSKPYVCECFSTKFLCSCDFLWKLVGRREHWITAAQHAAFHLHGWHSFCLESVTDSSAGSLPFESSFIWFLAFGDEFISPCTLFTRECDFQEILGVLEDYFGGKILQRGREIWIQEGEIPAVLYVKAWSTTQKLKVKIAEVVEIFWCGRSREVIVSA